MNKKKAFNSRPHTEVDEVSCPQMIELFNFQLTTSHGGRLSHAYQQTFERVFQLTTSHGGRLPSARLSSIFTPLSTHDLTRRSTFSSSSVNWNSTFQLTTSHGGRLPPCNTFTISGLFQLTTSHGGRPYAILLYMKSQNPFNSRPHTEVDERRRICRSNSVPFNSRPHTEVDYCKRGKCNFYKPFQLTTSHGGRLPFVNRNPAGIIFQLTTSHGGRQ